MNYGMGQNFNPHTIRVGVIKNWDSKWIPDSKYDIEEEQKETEFLYNNFSISNLCCNLSLKDRKIKLQNLLGKNGYKKVTNKVKSLNRR